MLSWICKYQMTYSSISLCPTYNYSTVFKNKSKSIFENIWNICKHFSTFSIRLNIFPCPRVLFHGKNRESRAVQLSVNIYVNWRKMRFAPRWCSYSIINATWFNIVLSNEKTRLKSFLRFQLWLKCPNAFWVSVQMILVLFLE